MKLSSSAFQNGEDIPKRFTCDGENLSPPLAWNGAPQGLAASRFSATIPTPRAEPGGIGRFTTSRPIAWSCPKAREMAARRV